MKYDFKAIEDAFEDANLGGMEFEHHAVLNLETGETHCFSEGLDTENKPEDLDDLNKYLWLPHRKELNLGRNLVFEFAEEFLPKDVDTIERIFSHRGAYAKFKDLLDRRGKLQAWYDFEAAATRKALLEWCKEMELDIEM